MTDGQTDRRTELRWLRRAIAVPAVARKNGPISGSEHYIQTQPNSRRTGHTNKHRAAVTLINRRINYNYRISRRTVPLGPITSGAGCGWG